MKPYNRLVQTLVAPELHCALKIHAARQDTTIAAVVRNLIKTQCVGESPVSQVGKRTSRDERRA